MKNGNSIIAALIALSVMVSVASFVKGLRYEYLGSGVVYLWTLICALLIAKWAVNDKGDQKEIDLDWGYVFFFFWPFAMPYYLIKTRGFQSGILMYLGFLFLGYFYLCSNLIAFAYFTE